MPIPEVGRTIISLNGTRPTQKRVCLVWPKSTFLIDPMVYPPLGLWYLWAECERLGLEVGYRDLAEDKLPYDYDAYLVSGTSPQAPEIRKVVRELKAHAPHARVILGGSHAMTHPGEMLLGYGADVVVQCEGDIPNLLAAALTCPTGTALRYPLMPELEHLGLPVRKAAWRYRAFLTDWEEKKHPTTTMFTSRGCPMRCAFCETQSMWGRGVRWTPFETVKREIEEILHLGFTGIMFYDDIFPLNKPRTMQMLDVLRYYHETQGLIWRCFLRVDVLEKQGGYEYLKAMREAGLREVLAGVESGSNQIKRNIRKGTVIEQDTQALKWCKELGVLFKASTILGLPGETRETMETTRRWILENRPDRVDVCLYIPFPGTPITTSQAEGRDEFDIYIDPRELENGQFPEEYFYKGPRERGKSLVGTSALTPGDISEFHGRLLEEVKAAGIPY